VMRASSTICLNIPSLFGPDIELKAASVVL
jgi:hypothetical protein